MIKAERTSLLFALSFFGVISITIGLSRIQGGLALTWLGTAVGAGWLLAMPRKRWFSTLACLAILSATATSLFGFGPRLALPLAFANSLECLIVAGLMLLARPKRDWFDNVGGLAAFIFVAGFMAPVLPGAVGAMSVSLLVGNVWSHHILQWWAAHGLGTVITLPIVHAIAFSARSRGEPGLWRAKAVEFCIHGVLIFGISVLSIAQSRYPILFLPVVPILLAAFRLGRAGAVTGAFIVSGVAFWAFATDKTLINNLAMSEAGKLLFLQFYIATLSLLSIPTSVALRHHRLVLQELEYRKALQLLIAEHSDDALVNLDENGLVRFASPASHRLTGQDDFEGRHLSHFFEPLDRGFVLDALESAAENPDTTVVIERPVIAHGEELWLEARVRTASLNNATMSLAGFAVTIRDVTMRKLSELDAIHAAETDVLTQLPNRRLLLQKLESALARARVRPFSLAIIDLDHFKTINDSHGHVGGDAVLRDVADVLKSFCGPKRIIGRLGGEEFAMIDLQPDFDRAEATAEDLRGAIAAILPRDAEGARFSLTASIGLVQLSETRALAEALEMADRLLYLAKRKGRNCVVTRRANMTEGDRRAA